MARRATFLRRAVVTSLLLLPLTATAASCQQTGFTVVFVNGIFTSEKEAKDSALILERLISSLESKESLFVRTGYNATHLSGTGDLIQSITQAFNSPISTYDLNTILMQIHPEVKTQKILLVGHSQGSFYANEMYQYLVDNGIPKESIGVYHVATPAVFVAGGGQYITSTNDKVINRVRETEVGGNVNIYRESRGTLGSVVASALRANITIPPEDGYEEKDNAGHAFRVYADGAGERMVGDIQTALSRLKATEEVTVEDGCFTPPEKDVSHRLKAAAYAAADPLSNLLYHVGKSVVENVETLALHAAVPRGAGAMFVLDAFKSLAGSAEPSTQTSAATAAFDAGDTSTKADKSTIPSAIAITQPSNPPAPAVNTSPASEPLNTEPASQSVGPQGSVYTLPFALPPGMSPGFGGGGAPPTTHTPVPPAPIASFAVTSPSDGIHVATTTVTFVGTADGGAEVFADAGVSTSSAVADTGGDWTLSLSLPEGTHGVSLSSVAASAVTRTVTVDITPPATTSLVVEECGFSLVSASCLVPIASLTLSWADVPDAASYGVVVNGDVIVTTIATSGTAAVAADAVNTLAVATYDTAGNAATSSEVSVRTLESTLIINEVGWAGTGSAQLNQWVEIKNMSSEPIELTHIQLERSGGDPIPLSGFSGTLMPGDIASFNQFNASLRGTNIPVSPFSSLGTSTAERLALVWHGTTLDATPAEDACSGWCAGAWEATLGGNVSGKNAHVTPLSMERVSPSADGALASSWRSTDSYGPATAPGQGSVWGTPGSENSAGQPESGVACGGYTNLVQANAPYKLTGSCYYLMKFITPGSTGPSRFGVLYRGTVGSSTSLWGHLFSNSILREQSDAVPADVVAGEDFFFSIYEHRSFANDSTDFSNYFTTGAGTPPHGNYVTIPFTYQP